MTTDALDTAGFMALRPEMRATIIATYRQLSETANLIGNHAERDYCTARADVLEAENTVTWTEDAA